jgi:hypothetical protein
MSKQINNIEVDPRSLLSKIISRRIRGLFISLIYILEDVLDSGGISDDDFNKYRKRILDMGNGAARDLEDQIEDFEVKLERHVETTVTQNENSNQKECACSRESK